jgi:glycosyltransferase involved in cell wall biosynthesis
MNILHLEASPGWGGQEIRILREAQGMKRRGHTVILCVMKGGGLVAEACKAGFTVYELAYQKKTWLITFIRLLIIMRRHRIDLVNTHSSLDGWIGGFAARLMRIPIVRTRHLSTPIKPGLNSRILYGFLADFVVTTCSAILPMISSQSGKPLSRIRSIATGVDPDRMQFSKEEVKEFRRSLNLSDDDFLIGTACFMRSWKGINDFLEAARILRDRKNLKWVIIGGGHQDSYRQRAVDLDLGKIVYFTGHLSNPVFALEALDAFALLSTAHEGVSQAILQAAYLAKPLIATSVGGLCEVCLDGKTGISVPAFSPQKVAEAVEKLMNDRHASAQLGKSARELVVNHFTMQHTLDRMEEVYGSCCQIVSNRLQS